MQRMKDIVMNNIMELLHVQKVHAKKHISSYSTGKEAYGIFFATMPI